MTPADWNAQWAGDPRGALPIPRNFISEHLRARDVSIFTLLVARMSIEQRLDFIGELLDTPHIPKGK